MDELRRIPLSVIALVCLLLTSTAAAAQIKTSTPSPPTKSSSVAARTVPTIKCADPGSEAACKSFNQLVGARDKDLLNSLTGDRGSRAKHFAYVCLRPKVDFFQIVEFDVPLSEEYRPYSPADPAKDLSVLANELAAFPYTKDKPVVSTMNAQKKWFDDHDGYSRYHFGRVSVDSWENGILAGFVDDFGKWRQPILTQGRADSDEDASFEGAHQWLTRFNEDNANELAAADDREYAHISVTDSNISVHYSFKNANNDDTGYTLNIQRSTGRFTESFEAPSVEPFENSGTCVRFKY